MTTTEQIVMLPVLVSNMRSRKDRSWSITIDTNELSPSQVAEVAEMQNQFGFMAFKKEDFVESEKSLMSEIKTDFDKGKSPSKRLYNVFYILFKQDNEGYSEFKGFYDSKMEKLITHYKDKIKQV